MTLEQTIERSIRAIPGFPKPGIIFRDISPMLANPEAFAAVVELFSKRYDGAIDAIAGIDSRGFIFGAPTAIELGVPFVMIRKPGKLPGDVISESYSLEYGENTLEIQEDAIEPGQRILLVDDLLATGGSAKAAINLLRSIGADVVAAAFVIELVGLGGRETLDGTDVFSIVTFKEE